jgi:hypothetical protein
VSPLREEWLTKAVEGLRPLYSKVDLVLPPVRVSTGWPLAGGLRKNNPVIGQCWLPETAADGVGQIFISPALDKGLLVLETLVHELAHACLPPEAKHGREFKDAAKKLGLEGKATSTRAGEALRVHLETLMDDPAGPCLGIYPHAALSKVLGEAKPQATRMLKISCPKAHELHDGAGDYTLRGSKKIVDLGLPECPVCGTQLELEPKSTEKA